LSTLARPIDRPTRGAFSSSRQAFVSDVLPSPSHAALATGTRRQPNPRHCHFAATPAFPSLPPYAVATRRSSNFPSAPPRLKTRVVRGSGHSPSSLVACHSGASLHLHSAPPSAHQDRTWCTSSGGLKACAPTFTAATAAPESSTPTLSVKCASRGGRRVPRSLEAAAISTP
jgi:hypothetical protein